MKNFYTNVQCVGDNIMFRGVVDGKRRSDKIEYYPTVFVPTNKETKYSTLEGKKVGAVKPGTIRETRNFIKKYKGVNGFEIYGNDNFQYCYIGDVYGNGLEYNKDLISII